MLVKYINKIVNVEQVFQFPIQFYEDAHTLVDKISAKKNVIEIMPKN